MIDTHHSSRVFASPAAWLHLGGVLVAIGIFAAMFFLYATYQQQGTPAGYLPLVAGVISFFVLMFSLLYVGTSAHTSRGRIAKAAAFALIETTAFVYLFMLVLLNTFGS